MQIYYQESTCHQHRILTWSTIVLHHIKCFSHVVRRHMTELLRPVRRIDGRQHCRSRGVRRPHIKLTTLQNYDFTITATCLSNLFCSTDRLRLAPQRNPRSHLIWLFVLPLLRGWSNKFTQYKEITENVTKTHYLRPKVREFGAKNISSSSSVF